MEEVKTLLEFCLKYKEELKWSRTLWERFVFENKSFTKHIKLRMSRKKSILFICLGNICRSPTAEALFRHLVEEKGLEDQWYIDSAAVMDYWIGNRPDDRTLDVLHRHNISSDHRVRQVKKEDFKKFDYIVGMDDDNMSDLHDLDPKANRCELLMLGYYDPEGQHIVKDPFYGHSAGFETMYEHCYRCCQALLTALT